MELHPSQQRVSCELCRKAKAKCQRLQPDDPKCIRCTLNNACCDVGQQRKVGRPKRKDLVSSSSSEGQTINLAKRQRKSIKPTSQSNGVVAPRQTDGDFVRVRHDGYEGFAQTCMPESEASRFDPSTQATVSTSDLEVSDTGWLGWPSFLTDRWCHKTLPAAASGRIIAEWESSPPHDTQPRYSANLPMDGHLDGSPYDLLMPSAIDQAIFQGSLAWINPDLWVTSSPNPYHGAVKKKEKRILPFVIGKPPTYYVHEKMFSSDPRDAASYDIGIDGSGAMARLINIVYGLRLRSTTVQHNKGKINLGLLIHRKGPLFIGNYALSEYVMTSAQELEQIVTSLLITTGSGFRPDDELSACVISTIVDVYCRLLSFFELFLEHLTDRAEAFLSDPVTPIPGLTYNGVLLTGPCTQGTVFSSSIYYLLGRLDNALGLDSFSGRGLLSSDQMDDLCDKLDTSNSLVQSRGIIRPADMRKLYAQAAAVLEQLAMNEM